ncbi:ABC transporter transmembrane domain-containing protein [Rhodocytophaga aerolata]|uniref:ABC transporter transmembrane domain-containing protein n=1 Tax=Rhodocytophaga aerolata TaxID=455078 RepID=A0ABT8R3Y7_9BACT|nr:ABC transporter transmembrane domain-containing protein [Rhodocytophaga aerolata]MDO1446805.1 ABC transporter transmembrane domain-containing protein [Rhodocytophaga aerolata]
MAKRRSGDRSNGQPEENTKTKITKESLRQASELFRFVLPYKGTFIAGLIFLVLSSLTTLIFPRFAGMLIDAAENRVEFSVSQVALALVAVFVVQSTFSFFRVTLFAKVSERSMRDIRIAVYSKIITLPLPFFEKRRVGELVSRLTSDISQLQDVLSFTLAEIIRQIITLIVGITIIFTLFPELTVFMLSTFPVLVIGAVMFGKFIRKLSRKAQDELANANVVVEETMQSIHVVKAFTNEYYEIKRYDTALEKVIANALKAARYRGAFNSFIIMAIFGGIVGVLWYGATLLEEDVLTVGQLTTFILYTAFIGGAVGGMGDLYAQVQKAIGASERIREILREEVEVSKPLPVADRSTQKIYGDIAFRNVTFAYPTRQDIDVLKDISFEIGAGQKIALVGYSGAGKSTIVQLLLRYYTTERGGIIVDGKDIRQFDILQLRQNIGIVPQEVILFGGSIKENIAYGKPDATDEEILQAARKANALDFIQSFPEGMQTLVGERGVKLSGGQRQRIAIARAILKDPAILILDEATSSLDAESEKLVQEALDTLMKGRTTIIIAHRLATIRKVDHIYVISEGRIRESGTHEELVQVEEGLYHNLVKLQFEID